MHPVTLSSPDLVQLTTDAGRDDHAATVDFLPDGTVRLSGATAPLRSLTLRWNQPLPTGARVLGDHWERGYGDLEWRGYVPERVLPWYALLFDPATGETHGFGIQTGAASIAHWKLDEEGITLVLDLRSGGKGVHLGERVLDAATVVFHTGTPRSFCQALCPAPRLADHVVYGGNDWYYAYGNNSDTSIRRDAALIRELSPSRNNAPYMVIDAGWFPAQGCDGGPYTHGNDRFPDLPSLAAGMTALGVRPGIWVRPLLTGDESIPESWWLSRKERGIFLDPSVPEVLALVAADIQRLRDWGYDLIKHDFTTWDITGRWGFEMTSSLTADGWTFADNTKTTAEVLNQLYKAIRRAAGEAVLIGCNTVGHLGAGHFELQRTGDDTSGREWERTRKMGVNTLAFRMAQHETFFAADADCVGLTNDVPWEKNAQWLDLLARSGTPLFVSADPAAVGPEQRAALLDAFSRAAVPQAPAEPLDGLHTTCPRRWRFADGTEKTYAWGGAA